VKPSPFGYRRPDSVAAALAALAEPGRTAKVLAGGQSLVPLLSMRLAAPAHLVDIGKLTGLSYVRVDGGQVRAGALARHTQVLCDRPAAAAQPLLAQALRYVAHPAIRNRGTVVGSLAHADPAGELTAVLAVLGGSVRAASAGGERLIPASEFFLGPMETALRPDELATEALFPVLPPRAGTAFAEISRRGGDYAVAGVAVLAELGGDGRVRQARAAYLAAGPGPVVADLTEAVAGIGEVPASGDSPAARAAAGAARASVDPEPDIHASADYRRHLAGVLTVRALREAVAMAHARVAGGEAAGGEAAGTGEAVTGAPAAGEAATGEAVTGSRGADD
jgi:aerobic carbon-monoxide dehydrogenase medium subunit